MDRRKKTTGKIKGMFHTSGTKHGSYSVWLTVLVIAIVIVFNLVIGQIPEAYRNLDMSSTKIYEAAFQAQKTLSAREQRKFCIFRMHNPSDAKKLGRDLTLRPDWEKVKVRLMYEICMCKFMQNPELRDKLLATGESTLIEGNNWGDYFWGKVNNCGENQLGIILMDVRAKLQWNAETAPNNIPQCLQ